MKRFIYLVIAIFVMTACENHIDITMPVGPQGADGKSAFEVWREYFKKPDATEEDYFAFLKGSDGQDGFTPYIGENGNWYLGSEDTGVPARGQDGVNGQDGLTPTIGDNGNWYFGNVDTGKPSRGLNGANGVSPSIGDNGNWYLGSEDTGVPARGQDGVNGSNGQDGLTPTIKNGYWWIGGSNTGVPATGADGQDGQDGVCNDCCEDLDFTVHISSDCYGTPLDWGQPGQPGSPGWNYNPAINPNAAYLVTFYVDIEGFTPNTIVTAQLFNGQYYRIVFTKKTDNLGNLRGYVTATQLESKNALEKGIIFINDYKLRFTHPY